MDHVSTWFQASLLPERWDVAGVKCRALSVWHVFALHHEGNPYVCGGDVTRDNAASLLLCCTLNHARGKELFYKPFFRTKMIKRIAKKIMRVSIVDIDESIRDYLASCSRVPGHKEIERKGKSPVRQCAAPICWALVDFLCDGNPDKIEAAWDTPYAVAKCLFDAHRDIAGEDDTLESPEEEIRIDAYIAANGEK